jgi:hypothetical protein
MRLFGLLIAFLCTVTLSTAQSGKWVELFNGKDLKNWAVKITGHPLNDNYGNTFRVENGNMVVRYDQYKNFDEQYGHIFYNKPFSAYLLVMEYRFVGEQAKGGPGWATRNSGAMLHGQAPQTMGLKQDFPISLEMQLLGGDGQHERHTGNLCTPGTNVVRDGKLFTPHCIDSNSKTYAGDQWVHAEALVLGDSLIKHMVEGDTVMVYSNQRGLHFSAKREPPRRVPHRFSIRPVTLHAQTKSTGRYSATVTNPERPCVTITVCKFLYFAFNLLYRIL